MAFQLNIITPEAQVFQGEVDSVTVPALNGKMGILKNHAPLITGLAAGQLVYSLAGKQSEVAVDGGFVEVKDNVVSVMTDSAKLPA